MQASPLRIMQVHDSDVKLRMHVCLLALTRVEEEWHGNCIRMRAHVCVGESHLLTYQQCWI